MTKTLVGTPDPEPRRPGVAGAPRTSTFGYPAPAASITHMPFLVGEGGYINAQRISRTTSVSEVLYGQDPDRCVYCLHPIGAHDNATPGCTVCGCTRVVFDD